jgi:hypothetical protein
MMKYSWRYAIFGSVLLTQLTPFALPAQILTIQVGAPPPPPVPLVNHGDTWQYRKGTNEPQSDWKIAADAGLDSTWLSGPGGFGYGDGDDATVLADMLNFYNTVYSRRTFTVGALEPGRRLTLTMDWDDGFVAYLDGTEVLRSPNFTVANPLFDSRTVVNQNHEASAGGGAAPTVFDLGLAENLVPPGSHILAIHGINSDPASSDLSLIADLRLQGGTQVAGGGPLFAIVGTSQVPLTGTNTIPGATHVFVNGEEAFFEPATGLWSKTQTLTPGWNHLYVAAVNESGALLSSVQRDVVYESATTSAGGVLTANTVWNGGTIRVTAPVIVPEGITLTITGGAVVLLSPTGSIRATTNGTVAVTGTEGQPIVFGPADGATPWGELLAAGSNASLTLRHVETMAGQVRVVDDGTVLVEDSVMRDMSVRLLSEANRGRQLTFRRCHWNRYGQAHFDFTPVLIEDCLFENVSSDATDFAGAPAEIVIRRTTYRHGIGGNTDAVDTGSNLGLTVERCLIRDFPDKGVSIADQSHGTIVRDSLILRCGDGVSAYASSNCLVYGTTISGCSTGMFLRANAGEPAHLFGTNNIIWANNQGLSIVGGSTLALTFSDEQGGYAGTGNIQQDPLFVNPAAGDFRLRPGSPALGAGQGGVNMGATFPVGGLPAEPWDLAAVVIGTNEINLAWREDADNETGFEIQRSTDGANWAPVATVGAGVTNHAELTAQLFQRYYYRVRAVNGSGASRYSNLAGAIRQPLQTIVHGGVLTGNTVWSPALGTILVMSNVVVPTNVTLTIEAGTVVRVTNTAAIRAQAGGTITIAGTAENKVLLQAMEPGALWGDLSARFAGSTLTVRHAEIVGSQTTAYSNAVVLLEDSYFHDYRRAGATILIAPIIMSHYAGSMTMRRCHIREYYEVLLRNGVETVEDCLFEHVNGDVIDFDSAQPGTVLRRCTFRHGTDGNVDAVDVGPGDIPGSTDVVIEDCMMYDFPFDKGVSVGDQGSSHGIVVRNCFIFNCLSGVMAKDLCEVSVQNCTLVNNQWGFTNYNKVNPSAPTGAGITTNTFNNILWNNTTTISMWNDGRLYADHNDFSATNWPGTGNIDVDPLFVDAAAGDFRLRPESPARGVGRDGADLGARFPVGCPMVLSHPVIESFSLNGSETVIRFWADNEKQYSVFTSTALTGQPWVKIADIPLGTVPRFLSVTNTLGPANAFFKTLRF